MRHSDALSKLQHANIAHNDDTNMLMLSRYNSYHGSVPTFCNKQKCHSFCRYLVSDKSKGTRICSPNVMAIHAIVFETFYSKLLISTSWWCYRKSQGIIPVSRILPLGTLDVFTKCHGNALNSYFSLDQSIVD